MNIPLRPTTLRITMTHPSCGFSLLELLLVVAVMMIALGLTVPAVVGIQRSYYLTKSASQIKDHLQFARQQAMALNSPVVASFCQVKEDSGAQSNYSVLLLSRLLADGLTRVPISKPIRLSGEIIISADPAWSSIMLLPTAANSFQSESVPCKEIRFKASGSTDLASSTSWYLTLFHGQSSSAPSDNYVTLVIDPVTGRIVWNQP
jgi:uncharacterized protein (TIGR02596 family)